MHGEMMVECNNKTIGERIRYYRTQQGLSQKELGICCGFKDNVAGEQIRHFESGKRVPKKAIIVKLAEVLSINPISLEIGILSDYSYEEILKELITSTGYHCGDILRKRKEPYQYGKTVIYIREKGRGKEKDKAVLLTKTGFKTMVKWKLKGYEKVGCVLPELYDLTQQNIGTGK